MTATGELEKVNTEEGWAVAVLAALAGGTVASKRKPGARIRNRWCNCAALDYGSLVHKEPVRLTIRGRISDRPFRSLWKPVLSEIEET